MATAAGRGTGTAETAVEVTIGDGPATLSLVSGRVDGFVRKWEADGDPPRLADFVPADPPRMPTTRCGSYATSSSIALGP